MSASNETSDVPEWRVVDPSNSAGNQGLTPEPSDDSPRRRRAGLIAGGVLLAFVAGAGGFLARDLLSDEGTEQVAGPTTEETTSESNNATGTDDGADNTIASEDASADAAPASTTTSSSVDPTTSTTVDVQAHLDAVADGDPSPRAVFENGKVTLLGAVPAQEISDTIQAGASTDLGPENVINEFVVDPTSTWTPDQGFPVEFADVVFFEVGSAVVAEEFFPIIQISVMFLSTRPDATITVITHTDSSGSSDFNQELSADRANALIDLMVANGANPEQLIADPRGETEAQGEDDTSRALDRRAEIQLDGVMG